MQTVEHHFFLSQNNFFEGLISWKASAHFLKCAGKKCFLDLRRIWCLLKLERYEWDKFAGSRGNFDKSYRNIPVDTRTYQGSAGPRGHVRTKEALVAINLPQMESHSDIKWARKNSTLNNPTMYLYSEMTGMHKKKY